MDKHMRLNGIYGMHNFIIVRMKNNLICKIDWMIKHGHTLKNSTIISGFCPGIQFDDGADACGFKPGPSGVSRLAAAHDLIAIHLGQVRYANVLHVEQN